MLPTKGYFQDIECPFNNTTCGRPYCHFRHKKKPNENLEENLQDSSKTVVPTYKPTPKSELANIHNNRSHIPISYVPDLAFKRERTARPITRIETPTYKPTPLSILSSANKLDTSLPENHEHKETIKELQENIASNVYDPLKSEINFEDLSNEFDLIDDIINDTEEPPPSTINDNLIRLENDIEKQQNKLNLLQSELSTSDLGENENENKSKKGIKVEATSGKTKHTEKHSKSSVSQNVSTPVVIKKEKNDNDEKKVQIESKVSEEKAKKKEKERDSSKDKTKASGEKNKDKDKSSSSKSRENKDSSKSKEKSLKTNEKSSKTHKSSEREKHRKEEKKDSLKDDKKDLKDRHKSKNKSKDRSRSKSPSKKEQKRSKHRSESSSNSEHTSKEKKKSKHRSGSSSDSETYLSDSSVDKKVQKKSKNGKSTDRSHSKDKSKKVRKKSREKSTSRSRSRSLSKGKELKHKSRHRSGSSNGHKERDKKQSKSKEKDKEKSSEKPQKSDRKEKEKSKVRSSSKEKKSKNDSKKSHDDKKGKRKKSTSESNTSQFDNDNDNIQFDNDQMNMEDLIPSDIDLDLEDEDETMRQCYEIFNEYKPTPVQSLQSEPKRETEYKDLFEEDNNLYQAKKRVAYAGAANITTSLKEPAPPKPKSIRPGQTLLNRYRIAQMAQGSNEQQNIINEVRSMTQQPIKRPATSLLEAARQHKMKKLEQQRLRELEKEKQKPASLVDEILNGVHKPSQSQVKAAPKKIAAVPNVALIQKAKERISFIKQQRMQVAAKTTAQTQKTGRVAHVPQFTLADIPDVLEAEKSKLPVNVRTRFLTMIAEECTKLYALKQDAFTRALNEEFTCYEKCKVLATYRNSAMLAVNRLRKELQDREVKGLGRLLSGESAVSEKESDFKGRRFYEHVKKWILSEEDLDVHGYPRESGERGKAIINNREVVDYSIVDNNHRKCSRCHRIYQVDDDGWPLFEEECMYHPNKKRTIRGEQVFLCCKSSDDTGCVTSDTHVFDGLKEHLLEGFQTTLPPESDNDPRNIAVYALDCEMCYTTKGLELTRVTIVDIDSKTVYESFVKPMNPIIDYNTRFSGITKEQMDRTSTSILQIQANILHLCNSETILVGHSLESDLKALKIVHGTVIDTSVLFPHKMGLPHKRALRALASEYLRKIIQNDVSGHDSAEDAITCMELVRWKLKEELKVRTK